MTANNLLKKGSEILKKNHIKTHVLDSELILSNLTGKSRENFLINSNIKISKDQVNNFNNLIMRRALKKEPIAFLLKYKEFWSTKFNVQKGVLIPRPETELMVDKLVKLFGNKSPFILDVGTGSGCIIISLLLELKKSRGIAIDISDKALKLARKNSLNTNVFNRLRLYKSSIESFNAYKFDLIVSNPPYIATHQIKNLDDGIKFFEPKLALDGGNDGLDVIKKVIYKSRKILKLNGILALEIGNGQYNKVSQILRLNGFKENFLISDYKDNIRCVFSVLK